jgi:hypothetical protein
VAQLDVDVRRAARVGHRADGAKAPAHRRCRCARRRSPGSRGRSPGSAATPGWRYCASASHCQISTSALSIARPWCRPPRRSASARCSPLRADGLAAAAHRVRSASQSGQRCVAPARGRVERAVGHRCQHAACRSAAPARRQRSGRPASSRRGFGWKACMPLPSCRVPMTPAQRTRAPPLARPALDPGPAAGLPGHARARFPSTPTCRPLPASRASLGHAGADAADAVGLPVRLCADEPVPRRAVRQLRPPAGGAGGVAVFTLASVGCALSTSIGAAGRSSARCRACRPGRAWWCRAPSSATCSRRPTRSG